MEEKSCRLLLERLKRTVHDRLRQRVRPVLLPEPERQLFCLLQKAPRPQPWGEIQALLAAAFEPLLCSIVAKIGIHTARFDEGDRLQEGRVALLQAINGFDPERGYRFSTYAQPRILGALLRARSEAQSSLSIPRAMQQEIRKLHKAADHLLTHLERPPRPEEIAAVMGLSEEETIELILAANEVDSLDAPLGGDGDGTILRLDALADTSQVSPEEEALRAAGIEAALATLGERDAAIFRLSAQELTDQEIADRLNCPIGTVKSAQFRKRPQLQTQWIALGFLDASAVSTPLLLPQTSQKKQTAPQRAALEETK